MEVAKILQSISQIDDATQQNSALVEQMAAAASHLSTQAQELVQTAAIFILNQADDRRVHRVEPAMSSGMESAMLLQ
jgi:acyl-ACP thioesterase